jgi:hypothetical protein
MVVGITVAGLKKPTKMAEAEAIAATVWKKMEPAVSSQTGPRTPRPLNQRGAAPNTAASGSQAATGTGQKIRVANTGGTGVRLRTQPSRTSQVASVLPEGTVLEIVGPDAQGDGLTWKNVRAPGDGRGYVAADYTAAVAGSPPAPAAASQPAPQPAASSPPAPAQPAASASPSTTANSSATTPQSAVQSDALKVDVSFKSNEMKTGGEQTVTITITKNGQPVPNAQVTVKTSPTGDTPNAPATDASGKSTVTWKPTGSGGSFVGVGVSALASDGSAGVGGASFRLT